MVQRESEHKASSQGSQTGPPAYPMIEMRKRLMWAEGEIARLKDETRIGWLERALEREQQLRRDAEHHLATLKAYCDTQPFPDEVERLRSALVEIVTAPDDFTNQSLRLLADAALSLDAPSVPSSSDALKGKQG